MGSQTVVCGLHEDENYSYNNTNNIFASSTVLTSALMVTKVTE